MYPTALVELLCLIEKKFVDQLCLILHHWKFQALESRWRGLMLLIEKSDPTVRLRCLDLTEREWQRDLLNAIEFDQNYLFQKIYSAELDHPGGQPYGMLVADYEVKSSEMWQALRVMSLICEASFVPFIVEATAELFGFNDFSEITAEHDLHHPLKKMPGKFVGHALPKFLLRIPNPHYFLPGWGEFQEATPSSKNYLWGSATYFAALQVSQIFQASGWFMNFSELPCELPLAYFQSDAPGAAPKLLKELEFTAVHHAQLAALGVVLPAPPLFCACRMAHYLKVMLREKVGKFMTALECEQFLEAWLFSYCARYADSEDQWQRYPLQKAKVAVTEGGSLADHYQCRVDLWIRDAHFAFTMGERRS